MEVCAVEQVFHAGRYPLFPFCMLTLGTVTVTAGVVSEDFVFAVRVVTALNMSSESSGSADGQGMEGSLMVFERIMGCAEGITV